MKIRLLSLLISMALIGAACSTAPATEVIETVQEIVVTQEPAMTEAVVETEPPIPTEAEVQENEGMDEVSATEEPTGEETMSGEMVFAIVPEETEARFLIDEVLFGSPFTVVGATNAVAGEIKADPNDPNSAQVSIIVDVTTLVTDDSRRNGAIQNWILETGQPENQVAVFNSTSVSGVPGPVVVGQPFDFQINGDLTVKGTTRPLRFEGTAVLVSPDRLEGSAATAILYTDFTTIPRLPPQVASVEEETILEIDFAATAE
jgi:polyisoprenoid-binding protein YceI